MMAQHANLFQQLLLARRFKHEIDLALELDPRDCQGLRDLMEFYLLAPGIAGGDAEKARATAARIARVDAVEGFAAQARLAEVAGDTARMEAMLHRAVDAGPSNYRARVALAGFAVAHGNLDEARRSAEAAVEIDGTRVDAYAVLARVHAMRGEMAQLEARLVAAERQVPDDLTPYYRAADALISEGREWDWAEQYLRRYLAAEPEGNAPTLAEARRKLEQILEKRKRSMRAQRFYQVANRPDR